MGRDVSFPNLLKERGLLGAGAEIGVWRGEFSAQVLLRWAGKRYVMVDSWRVWPREEWPDPTVAYCDHEDNFKAASQIAAHFTKLGVSVRVMRMPSLEAAAKFDDGELDWVYIDANHSAAYVRADIHAWMPKVRSGGVLAGHDYIEGHRADIQVKRVVDELFGARVNVLADAIPSWWVEVP